MIFTNEKFLSVKKDIDEKPILLEEPVKILKKITFESLQIEQNKANYGKTIIPCDAHPEKHEKEIANILNKYGKNVEFLVPVEIKSAKTPDIKMDDELWEIKSPKGNSDRTIETNLRRASKQSKNIIIDLRRIKLEETKAISQILREVKLRKAIKKIIIIRKNSEAQQILDINK